ncbi:hypothetical protein [Hymenobacter weizhouensis]|uniref:hypothetical protein n=1 Tax=Hymenobacter sp. YIM 151500-1 TaxID=2987689 RepID=UPI0022262A01|nr:hypothetical protein [Hymenobacter sp. YIM 151500-1]UYZ62800.1 hypothetical protein OIS53_17605 [Hymenobacter sp. YIM 151500-1]
MTSTYYQPSGRFTMGGVLGFVLLGAVVAFFLAFAYAYAIWYVPFIYFNVAFTVIFGGALGYVLKKLTKAGKLRNPALVGWLSLGVAVWAWYVHWAVYITLLAGAGETQALGSRASYTSTTFEADLFLGLLLSPAELLGFLPRIAEEGTWSLFGTTPSGFFLYLIWLLEFLGIVLTAWFFPRDQAGQPFSELASEWAEKITLPQSAVAFADAAATKAALEAADWNHLQPLPAEAPASPSGRLHFYQAPHDPDCCYLSLENVTIETDKNGKPSEKTDEVVAYLRVPPQVRQELHARFGAAALVSAS